MNMNKYALFVIYGDERISTGIGIPGKHVAELHRFKSNILKLTDNNKSVALAA